MGDRHGRTLGRGRRLLYRGFALEEFGDEMGRRIPGSRFYRWACSTCGTPIRVPMFTADCRCERCRPPKPRGRRAVKLWTLRTEEREPCSTG